MEKPEKEKKSERLNYLKEILKNKKNVAQDFQDRYNIDFDILLDPSHP